MRLRPCTLTISLLDALHAITLNNFREMDFHGEKILVEEKISIVRGGGRGQIVVGFLEVMDFNGREGDNGEDVSCLGLLEDINVVHHEDSTRSQRTIQSTH